MLKNILYNFIYLFFPLFLNKTQTLSFSHIVCACLALCSCLFGYKFALVVMVGRVGLGGFVL